MTANRANVSLSASPRLISRAASQSANVQSVIRSASGLTFVDMNVSIGNNPTTVAHDS